MAEVPTSEKRLSRNMVANFFGQVVSASMAVLFVPSYVNILGIEAYGLIGFYTLIQMFLTVLEMGIYPVLGRHMARFTAGKIDAQRVRDLLKTYLVITVLAGALLALLIGSISGVLARNWFNLTELSPDLVSQSLVMIGFVVGVRLVEVVFRSVILGLQYQVVYNVIFSLAAIMRYGGVIAFLLFFESSITAFFQWQIIVSLIGVSCYMVVCLRSLPASDGKGRFSLSVLAQTGRFATGTMLITLLSVSYRQLDKLYLSKVIDLSEFGYYSFASMLAYMPILMVGPLYQAFYPRFVELFAKENGEEIRSAYLRSTVYAGIIATVSGVPLMFFSEEVVWVWSGDRQLAEGVSRFLPILVIGGVIDAILYMPFCVQIAYGWTWLALVMFGVSLPMFLLAVAITVPSFGPVSAAWAWVGVNVFLLLIWVPIMHRKILQRTALQWYIGSVFVPLSVAVAVGYLLSLVFAGDDSRWTGFISLGCIGLILLLVVAAATHYSHGALNRLIATR
tara:strand:- start:833 stop:2350 length:1518 start_codon:yes stop_codon:yes gene_type:complete